VIPSSALFGTEPSLRVFVAAGGVAEERVVLTGAADGDRVAILKGLRAGERVVNPPPAGLADGARLR
jgi:phosphopantothenate synthetase